MINKYENLLEEYTRNLDEIQKGRMLQTYDVYRELGLIEDLLVLYAYIEDHNLYYIRHVESKLRKDIRDSVGIKLSDQIINSIETIKPMYFNGEY